MGLGLLVAALLAANAPPVTVLVVSDEPASLLTRRTSAELKALGFGIALAPWRDESLEAEVLERMVLARSARGAIVLLHRVGRLEAWAPADASGRLVSHDLAPGVSAEVQITAFKLAETLRVSLLEHQSLLAREAPGPVEPLESMEPAPPSETPEPAGSPPRLWVGVTGGAVGSQETALGVLGAEAWLQLTAPLALRFAVWASLAPAQVTGAAGAARLSLQRLEVSGWYLPLEPQRPWQLALGLGAMAERFAAAGEALPPRTSADEARWTGGGRLAARLSLALARRLRLAVELGVAASPTTFSVRLGKEEVRRWGWLTWSATAFAEVGAWP